MSYKGAGRGRGWLNLPKSGELPRPGGILNAEPVLENRMEDLYPINPRYAEIANKIKEISADDDGIKFNQKMKQITKQWSATCTSQDSVSESIESLYNECMYDMNFGDKLIQLLFCNTISSLKILDISLKATFMGKLQAEFEKDLNTINRQAFRHCAHLIGQVFAISIAHSHTQYIAIMYDLLAEPLYKCMNCLLSNGTSADLSLLASLLHRLASSLSEKDPEAMEEFSLTLRKTLVFENESASKEEKLWMMLCLDLITLPRPTETLITFYSDLLSSATFDEMFSDCLQKLSIQTEHPSKTLDQYKSDVSVLQIAAPMPDISYEPQSYPPSNPDLISNNCLDRDVNNHFYHNPAMPEVTSGRPILGAGASHGPKYAENNVGYNNRANHSMGRMSNESIKYKNSKGWEHDDRFHHDYE